MNYEYVKVLLYVYPRLPEIAEAVSAGLENGALLSYRAKGSAFDAAEAIASEVIVKRNLEAVHAALSEIVPSLAREERFLLEYKYFRRKRELTQYGEIADCSERGYFRSQNRLLKKVAAMLSVRGWTESDYAEAFGDFSPFRKMYAALRNGRERKLAAKRSRRGITFRCAGEEA